MHALSRAWWKRHPIIGVADVALNSSGYLVQTGWLKSRKEGAPVDALGLPLPWYTFPAIRFLEAKIPSKAVVFEYGMGYSTLWWAARATKVLTCESDQAWFRRISARMPSNVAAELHPDVGVSYVQAASRASVPISVLVLDGRKRVESCRSSIDALTDDAVVVWDNSERVRYAEGYAMLEAAGFRRLDFWGLGPISPREWCTSVFYRDGNCLGV